MFLDIVDAAHPIARFRVTDHLDPVVDKASGVDRVLEQADPAACRADNGRHAPFAAIGGRDAFGIQAATDSLGATAIGIFFHDAADNDGLFRVDGPQSAIQLTPVVELSNHVIAIGPPAGDAPARHRAALTTADFVRHFLQLHGIHRAFQADVKL
nr:hypothetical protein [Novosphingobium sediminicola]